MKFIMDQSICEFRAKGLNDDWYTKKGTMDAMNWLSIVFDKAADTFEREGKTLLAHIARQDGTHIYNKLNDQGYYNN